MPRVPKSDTTYLPASKDFPHDSGSAHKRFSRAKREVVHSVYSEVVTNIKNTRSLVALQAVHIFRARGLAAAHGTVVDRMRPCVPRLKFQPLAEPALQSEPQGVVRARSNVMLVVDGAKGIAPRIVLVERADAIGIC